MPLFSLTSVDGPLARLLIDPWGTLCAALTSVASWLASWLPLVGPTAILVLVGVWWGLRRWRSACVDAWHANAQVVTIESPPTVDKHGGQGLWANLAELVARPVWKRLLFGTPALSWEYVFTAEAVQIRLWVPGTVPVVDVQRALETAWPGAHTRVQDPTPPLSVARKGRRVMVSGGSLRLARPEALPISTEIDHTDPLRSVLSAPGALAAGEQACVQILARPATGRRLARAQATRSPATGGGGGRAASWGVLLVRGLLDLLTPGAQVTSQAGSSRHSGPQARDPRVRKEASQQEAAMVDKHRGQQCETIVRYAVTTTVPDDPSQQQWRAARAQLRKRANTLASSLSGYHGHNYYRRHRLAHPLHALGRRFLRRGDLLSMPELAALAHLPTETTVAGLVQAGAKAVAPPAGVATPGAQVKPLGASDAGHARPVGLRVADARHHLHVLGATGVGKSTLLAQMILADVAQQRGTVVIDPKGDLVTDLLARLPKEAGPRVVLFDPDQAGPVPCLNPLDTGGDRDLAVDNLVSIFHRIYAASWGPRTEDVFRAACLTLRARDGVSTLAQLPRLLDDKAFRARVTEGISDPELRGFWKRYESLSESAQSATIAPLMNKLRAFLLRPFVRDALAGGPSTVDMGEILDGGICLVRIPKGRLGEDTTRLIGSLVVAAVWQAATARANTPHRDRRDASMVLDECHNFLNLPYSLEDMLAESRGYRLSLTLAHQHLGQLGRELREGIATNARSKVFFTAGPEDARELARHTAPRLSEHDLAHLDAFHAAARLVVRGQETPPFTLSTEPLPPVIPGRARYLRSHAARILAGNTRDHTPEPPEPEGDSGPEMQTHRDSPEPVTDPDDTADTSRESTVDEFLRSSVAGSEVREPDEILLDPEPDRASADVQGQVVESGEVLVEPENDAPEDSAPSVPEHPAGSRPGTPGDPRLSRPD